MTLEEQAAALNQNDIIALLVRQNELEHERVNYENQISNRDSRIVELTRQLEWFKRQYFGQRSERRIPEPDSRQMSLGETLSPEELPPPPTETVKAYQRRVGKEMLEDQVEETGLRFDSSVPVETIEVATPELEGLIEGEDYEVVSERVTHRLAQRPGSYVVLKYVRKVIKRRETEELICAPAPAAVLERSVADVSFLAGLLIDKFLYHLPLYRQHQRLRDSGIELSRQTLTNLVHRTVNLLEPVYYALLSSILQSKVLAMDEVPIKAGRSGKGKMHQGYFWPLYGDEDEVAFPYSPSRAHKTAREVLGEYCGTLVTDGYEAYERYAEQSSSVVHAQCWAHTRRNFVEAESIEPALVMRALELIRRLYDIEGRIQELGLSGVEKLEYRVEHSRAIVEEFFSFLEEALQAQLLLGSNPFTKAASYALERRASLSVFLSDRDVPIDTNHLERALRPIPLGRKNWLFCWTECGAEVVGKIQSLLVTCRLHGVDPYTYLVDVLQRIDSHPAFDVHLLTPRLWKENFAATPIRSYVDPRLATSP